MALPIRPAAGSTNASARPLAAKVRKPRRSTVCCARGARKASAGWVIVVLRVASQTADRVLDTLIRAADADIVHFRHYFLAVVPGRERSRAGHDHSGLAVPALGHLLGDPCFLRRGGCVFDKPSIVTIFFPAADDVSMSQDFSGFAVDQHRAGAADFDAAAVLGARQPEHVAQCPEQGGRRVDVDAVALPPFTFSVYMLAALL